PALRQIHDLEPESHDRPGDRNRQLPHLPELQEPDARIDCLVGRVGLEQVGLDVLGALHPRKVSRTPTHRQSFLGMVPGACRMLVDSSHFLPTQLPRHVAIIMDGNGRWAQRRGLPRVEGHRKGAVAVRNVVRAAREIGLQAITLYAFSAQNWERPPEEVATLMQLLREYCIDERDEIMDNDIRL